MALFQEAIIKKHLSLIDEQIIDAAFSEYKRVYSPDKIKNIRVAKEEQYQEGFIKDVFGAVLGYSVYPEHPYNIETEKKNESNAKKADGAILKDEKVVGVIELKDNKTKNLDAVKDQAFSYKNNHKECSYVISSNFHKLRFYIDDATEYEEFDLYNLDKETFKRFYLYLRKEGLLDKNLPKLLRQETKFHEEEISKKLYKDYSQFKRSFYENAVKNNPQHDKLILFKKSQKFLDRILFLLFAEDKGLVGTNSIVQLVEKWSDADDDYYQPLYEMVNKYFGHLYRGYTYQKTGEVIPQFGGELFAPDDLLETLKIDDDVLKNDLLILSRYDFNTDVDVNILGHIFEHSLNEIDDVEAELRGEKVDKTKSKRKKDGVFYTPKYITKYIVDNTLGKLCAAKKAELQLDQDIAIFDYQKADGKLNEKGKELFERLTNYKDWLLTIKVCDPACGSGAFLNQALSFFIEEHKFVDDIIAELTNTPLRLFDTDLQILENNIFGVDINEESIEIAKLSLWLRTAQPGRKLSDLSNNIKCGNSLIDDPVVAGDKAFNWEKEFPNVFERASTERSRSGGFDVVIGNPPYVSHDRIEHKSNLAEKYFCFSAFTDLYSFFYELGINILKEKGLLYYITSNSFLKAEYGKSLRKLILQNSTLLEIINIEDAQIFGGAIVNTVLLSLSKQKSYNLCTIVSRKYDQMNEDFHSFITNNCFSVNQNYFTEHAWSLSKPKLENLKRKLDKKGVSLEKLKTQIRLGIATGDNNAFIIDEIKKDYLIGLDSKNKEIIKPILRGRDIYRYNFKNQNLYILLTRNEIDVSNNYPTILSYLDTFGDGFKNRGAKGKHWTNLRACSFFDDFLKEKIVWIELTDKPRFTVITEEIYLLNSAYFLLPPKEINSRFLLAVLNSKVINFYLKMIANTSGMGTTRWINIYVKEFPIPVVNIESQNILISYVDNMIKLNSDISKLSDSFLNFISSKFNIEISNKLKKWQTLSFNNFLKELNSLGVYFTISEESQWLEYFNIQKDNYINLQINLERNDLLIDRMVYELYELTEEEIQIVENS